MSNEDPFCPVELSAITGGGPTMPAPKPIKPSAGQAAVAQAYTRLEEMQALRNEASRLWWSNNPNDRSTALFMLRRAGMPVY